MTAFPVRRAWTWRFPALMRLLLVLAVLCAGLAGGAASASEIRFVTLEEPPTNFLEDGEIVGTTVDLVREMARRLGVAPEIDFLPPARAFLVAETTPNRMLFTAALTEARRAHGYRAIGPVISRRHILYARKGSDLKVQTVHDLVGQGLTVSGMDADWRTSFLKEAGVLVETTPQHLLNLKKLMAERTDLWISSDIEAPAILAEAGVDWGEIEEAFVLRVAPSYILVSKDTDPKLLTRWRDAFDAVSVDEAFLREVSTKWSDRLGLSFGFSPDTGFHVMTDPAEDSKS